MSIPYMPLYVSDFEADTTHLNIEEDGAYNRLLRLCWRTPGCSVPSDPKWIARQMRVDIETFDRLVHPLIEEYFKIKKGRVFSPRQQVEFDRINSTTKKRSNAGKKGGRPPKLLKNNETGKSRDKAGPKQPEPEPYLDIEEEKIHKKENPIDVLKTVLSEQSARDVIEHRLKLKRPLTCRAASGLINQYLKCRDGPEAAVEAQITAGWVGFKPDWYDNQNGKGKSNGKRNYNAAEVRESIMQSSGLAPEDCGYRGQRDREQPYDRGTIDGAYTVVDPRPV